MTDEPLAGIPSPGQILLGKYRVERVLGVGGMGAVVSATHLQLEEKVAIKFLHASTAENPESVARFLREGKAVIKIRSEHAVKVHDVGRLENGAPYLVMEHLDGTDLDGLVRRGGPLPPSEVVDMCLQACEAIAEAHVLGIVHRDLKPANLFLTRRADGSPCVKVLDFGISKAGPSAQNVTMTRTQTVMGSPRYMSPEQMRSTRTVDARTDIWSLGVILYELLSGAPPFNGDSMTELCAQIIQDTPAPLPSLLPSIPAGLDAAVQRCLAKDPERRYPSLAELATAIAGFGSQSARASAERIGRLMNARGPATSRPDVSPSAPGSAPIAPVATGGTGPSAVPVAPPASPGTLDGASSTAAPRPRRVVALAGLAGVLALVAVIAGVSFLRGGRAPAFAGAPSASAPAAMAVAPASASAPSPATVAPDPTALPVVAATATPSASSATPVPSARAAAPPSAEVAAGAAPRTATPPAPRKRPATPTPPPQTAPPAGADGMFDGRK